MKALLAVSPLCVYCPWGTERGLCTREKIILREPPPAPHPMQLHSVSLTITWEGGVGHCLVGGCSTEQGFSVLSRLEGAKDPE